MQLQINGEPREFPGRLNLAALIAHLGMKADRVAVELNLEIVPRANWETTQLKDGDKLEVVHFVGGGSGIELKQPSDAGPDEGHATLAPDDWTCPTCGAQPAGAFCPACGEKKRSPEDFSLRHFLSHALGELFHYDSKIFRSFRLLFGRPGFLTAEYLRGCRKPYMHPFQIFFIANLIYFFAQPYTGWSGLKTTLEIQTHLMSYSSIASKMVEHRTAVLGVTSEQFARSFNHLVDVQARALVVVMVPLYALLLALLQVRKKRFFGEHLVFSLHFTAFWLIAFFIVVFGGSNAFGHLLARIGVHQSLFKSDPFLSWIGFIILGLYAVRALRTVYGESLFPALAKATVMAFALHYILDIYRFILFVSALYLA